MCYCCGETMNHSLLRREKVHQSWCFVFRSFGVSRVPSRTVPSLLFYCRNWLGKHSSDILNLVMLCLMWCIWRKHNRHTFENVDSSKDQLLASYSVYLFDWPRALRLTSSDCLPLFICSLLYSLVLFSLVTSFLFYSFSCLYYLTSLCFFCIK